MDKRVLGLLICLLIYSCASVKHYPSPLPPQLGEGIYKDKVRIYNNSNSSKNILLGHNEDFVNYLLDDNEVWLSPSFDFNPVVKIRTNDNIISYTLIRGFLYVIYWNEINKHWDIKKQK